MIFDKHIDDSVSSSSKTNKQKANYYKPKHNILIFIFFFAYFPSLRDEKQKFNEV